MYSYIKALHIVFVVTWFSGMFYVVRLFIYNSEAEEMGEPEKSILRKQFTIMIRRLWFGITWPSAVLTLILGGSLIFILDVIPTWLWIKFGFVLGLFAYHLSLHHIYKQQKEGSFKYSSQQLRIWNEVATIFLFAIVFLAVLKEGMGLLWGLAGLLLITAVLLTGIKVYKYIRAHK